MTATQEPIQTDTVPDDWGDSRRVGVLTSVRRHPLAFVLPLLILVAGALFIGLRRDPTYTAESRLIVGRLDVSAPGALAGFQDATQSLAAAYSRSVIAGGVVNPVSQRVGLSADTVRSRTSASPITDANVFRVTGTGSDKVSAVRLANATTVALIAYVLKLNRNNPDSDRLLRSFKSAALRYNQLLGTSTRLRARSDRVGTPSARRDADLAGSAAQAALLERETYRIAFQNSQSGQATSSQVQVLAPADDASSDRFTVLELLLVAAVVAGLLIGVALATLRANTGRSRSVTP